MQCLVRAKKEGNGSCDANANTAHQDQGMLPSARGFSVMDVMFQQS